MKDQLISEVARQMLPYLDNAQMEHLQEVLQHCLWNAQITIGDDGEWQQDRETNTELLEMFLSAKRVEGCSEKTLHYYETSIRRMFAVVDCHVTRMQTDDLRNYLSDYQQQSQCSKSNIDNIRRIMSSFFTWLEDENYVLKSPVRRIHKIRSTQTVKETYTDEAMETMRDQCGCLRDLAMPKDILMTEGGDPDKLGRGAIIENPPKDCIHQNHIFRVRVNCERVIPEFFEEYLQHQRAKRYFSGCAKQTTGIASISMTQLRNLPVIIPPLPLQHQFATFVEQTDKSKYYYKTFRKTVVISYANIERTN